MISDILVKASIYKKLKRREEELTQEEEGEERSQKKTGNEHVYQTDDRRMKRLEGWRK